MACYHCHDRQKEANSVEFRYQSGDELKTVQIERDGERYIVNVSGQTYRVAVQRSTADTLAFSIDDQHYRATVAADGPQHYVAFDSNIFTFTKAESVQVRRTNTAVESGLTATMPGQVVKVLVAEGDVVKRGQPLVIIEAMKMEMRIAAPADGQVATLLVTVGQIVERGQRLLEFSVGR